MCTCIAGVAHRNHQTETKIAYELRFTQHRITWRHGTYCAISHQPIHNGPSGQLQDESGASHKCLHVQGNRRYGINHYMEIWCPSSGRKHHVACYVGMSTSARPQPDHHSHHHGDLLLVKMQYFCCHTKPSHSNIDQQLQSPAASVNDYVAGSWQPAISRGDKRTSSWQAGRQKTKQQRTYALETLLRKALLLAASITSV